MNDLWRYNLNTNAWTWVSGSMSINSVGVYGTKGIESSTNAPGARQYHSMTFSQATQSLYVFGGRGYGGSASRLKRHGEVKDYHF